MRYEVEMLEYIPISHEELSDPEDEKQRKKSLARKAKSQKDPMLPQRAQTSWFFFSSEKRPLLKQEFPGIRITEMSKKISEMWRAMGNEAKKVWRSNSSHIHSPMRNVHKEIRRDINKPWKLTNLRRRRRILKRKRLVPRIGASHLPRSPPLPMMRREIDRAHRVRFNQMYDRHNQKCKVITHSIVISWHLASQHFIGDSSIKVVTWRCSNEGGD